MRAGSNPRWIVLLGLLGWGCAAADVRALLTPESTTWIQRGVTTPEQVVAKFGVPDWTSQRIRAGAVTRYAEYDLQAVVETYEVHGYSSPFEPRPRGGGGTPGGAAPEVQRPPLESIRAAGDGEERGPFWILYDERGVVIDYGFGAT